MSGLTLRAVAVGCVIGGVLGAGNVYLGLKTGIWDAGAVTAAILGAALLAPLARASGRAVSPHEINVTQTTAASASSMASVMGLMGAFPALALMGRELPPWTIAVWGLTLGAFGIVLALPLREQLVVREALPFPDSRATAEVIGAVGAGGGGARGRWLVGAAIVAAISTWLRDAPPRIVPGWVSAFYASVGVLIGWRHGLSMLLGGLIALALGADTAWLIWPGVGLIAGGGITQLAASAPTFVPALRDVIRARNGVGGAALAALAAVVLVVAWRVFGVHPLLGAGAIALSVIISAVCARAYGQTGIAPYGPMGQLAQVIFGAVAPGNAVTNVVAASIVAGDAPQTVQTTAALKVGHLIGTEQRGQIVGQLVGVFAGVAVALPAYLMLVRAYGLGSTALPVPFGQSWRAFGELAQRGLDGMPAGTMAAAGEGLACGVGLALLEQTRVRRWTPSPVAVGIAFLLPLVADATIALGAVGALVLERTRRPWAEANLTTLAAGGIVGESVMGIVIAALVVAGVL